MDFQHEGSNHIPQAKR